MREHMLSHSNSVRSVFRMTIFLFSHQWLYSLFPIQFHRIENIDILGGTLIDVQLVGLIVTVKMACNDIIWRGHNRKIEYIDHFWHIPNYDFCWGPSRCVGTYYKLIHIQHVRWISLAISRHNYNILFGGIGHAIHIDSLNILGFVRMAHWNKRRFNETVGKMLLYSCEYESYIDARWISIFHRNDYLIVNSQREVPA